MNRFYAFGVSAVLALSVLGGAPAQGVSQAFTYQGFLRQSGAPLTNPSQQMTFRIYDALTGGSLLWNSGTLTVNVNNGLFTVQLNAPASVWNGAERFLEIQVGATTLSPRVRLNPTPYANTSTQLNLFQSGTENPDRMVITHSPAYSSWGLQYRDLDDSFHFLGGGNSRLSINLLTGVLQYPLGAAAGHVLTSDASGNASWQPVSIAGLTAGGDLTGTYPNPTIAANAVNNAKLANDAASLSKVSGSVMHSVSGRIGVGTTNPRSNLHVFRGTSGAIPNSDAVIALENSSHAYVNVLAPSASETGVLFGNPTENAAGGIIYNHSATRNGLQFRTNGNATRAVITDTGNVGIGTTNPVSRLTVVSADTVPLTLVGDNTSAYINVYTPLNNREVGVLFSTPTFATGAVIYNNSFTPNGLQFRTNGATTRAVITDIGRMGIGTLSPAAPLHVQGVSGNRTTAIITSDAGAYRNPADWFSGWGGGLVTWDILCQGIRASNVIADNLVRTAVLEITGADLAEKFPTTDTVEAGMVVEIDPDNPGHLRKAQGAYNTRVAGVVAGANGLPTGIVLGNLEGSEQHTAIAMSGRVWVYADATERAIEPGTLLTTADKPGYAMAVRDRDRAQGAILGKAMTRLEQGKTGMVLVLVNLQ